VGAPKQRRWIGLGGGLQTARLKPRQDEAVDVASRPSARLQSWRRGALWRPEGPVLTVGCALLDPAGEEGHFAVVEGELRRGGGHAPFGIQVAESSDELAVARGTGNNGGQPKLIDCGVLSVEAKVSRWLLDAGPMAWEAPVREKWPNVGCEVDGRSSLLCSNCADQQRRGNGTGGPSRHHYNDTLRPTWWNGSHEVASLPHNQSQMRSRWLWAFIRRVAERRKRGIT